MKKIYLSLIALAVFTVGQSQEKGKIRVGFELGYASPSAGGGGVLSTFEPKYNIANNMNIGFRMQFAAMAKAAVSTNGVTADASLATSGSYVATYDYYFNKGNSSFAPYIGAGLGSFSLASVSISSGGQNFDLALDSSSKFGGLVRAGFEAGKFRMGVEYNIIPESTLKNVATGVTAGTMKNSYLGIHLGFYLGGGKWDSGSSKKAAAKKS